jgi:hypothetical protein
MPIFAMLSASCQALLSLAIKEWSMTSLKEKLIKTSAKVVSHGRYVAFQMAEVAIPKANVPGDFAAGRGTTATATARTSMRRPMPMRSRPTDGRAMSKCHRKWPDQTLDQAFGLPEMLVGVSTSRLSCKRAGKREH